MLELEVLNLGLEDSTLRRESNAYPYSRTAGGVMRGPGLSDWEGRPVIGHHSSLGSGGRAQLPGGFHLKISNATFMQIKLCPEQF